MRFFASAPADGASVTVCGWAKTVRDSKNIGFIELSDGSCFKPLQVVFEAAKLENYKDIAKAGVGTSLVVTGRVVLTPGPQPLEVNADSIRVLGACPPEYPLQKSAILWSSCVPCRICARARTRSARRSCAQRGGLRHPQVFAGKTVFIRAYAADHRVGLRRRGRDVSRLPRWTRPSRPGTEEGAVDFFPGLLRPPTNLTVSRPAGGRGDGHGLRKILYLSPHLPRRNSNTPRHAAEFG